MSNKTEILKLHENREKNTTIQIENADLGVAERKTSPWDRKSECQLDMAGPLSSTSVFTRVVVSCEMYI